MDAASRAAASATTSAATRPKLTQHSLTALDAAGSYHKRADDERSMASTSKASTVTIPSDQKILKNMLSCLEMRAAVPIPAVAAASVSHSAVVGGSVVGVIGLL